MGRGKGIKGKKSTLNDHDDPVSDEEEKIPAQKRRGRPQKPLKDEDIDEDAAEIIEEEDSENGKNGIPNTELKSSAVENGKKRKRSRVKEKHDSVKEENGNGIRSSTDESTRANGFRHSMHRRKNKPRRAAEAVVECN